MLLDLGELGPLQAVAGRARAEAGRQRENWGVTPSMHQASQGPQGPQTSSGPESYCTDGGTKVPGGTEAFPYM